MTLFHNVEKHFNVFEFCRSYSIPQQFHGNSKKQCALCEKLATETPLTESVNGHQVYIENRFVGSSLLEEKKRSVEESRPNYTKRVSTRVFLNFPNTNFPSVSGRHFESNILIDVLSALHGYKKN